VVGEFARVPRAGDRAPSIHTPTAADAGNDLEQITTRVPPDTQNRADFADVLGKEPVVLLFATPQFCQSRVCGPVVDVAEQVKEEYGEEAEFIHMEIFNENDPGKGVRPQVRAFHLPSEPWLFVIDRQGTIRTAIEGAFGVERLTDAVEGVVGE
jgi:peroxiredoxin